MNELLWYASRATGITSIVLLTVVVLLGVVTSGRRHPHGERATIVMAMHRWLSLGMVSFLAAHIATAIAESYVEIDLISAIVPFTSGYERVWMGLGTLAVDLLIALMATSWLRERLRPSVWSWIHRAAYALWPLAIVHGFMLGTANESLLRAITIGCAMVGAGAFAWRATTSYADRDVRVAVAHQEWS